MELLKNNGTILIHSPPFKMAIYHEHSFRFKSWRVSRNETLCIEP